jgi:hypothetical protein
MSTGTRLFFLDNDDGIHRISVSKFNRFYLQSDENESFPEFAGQRVRYALVLVNLEGWRKKCMTEACNWPRI